MGINNKISNPLILRIIVDAVVNHMAGLGRSGQGSGGSGFNSDNHDFPGVPFGPNDFTPRDLCPSANGQFNIICYARSF